MSKPNKKIIRDSGNGITITDSISLKINSTSSVLPKIFLIITALAGTAGFAASLISLFNLECDTAKLYAALAVEFILFSVLFMFSSSKAKFFLIPVYVLTAYGIYRTTDEFINGYAVFVNTIMQNLKIVKEGYSYYIIPEGTDQIYCLTLFLFFLLTVINSILCYNTIVKPRFIFNFCCTFPFIEIGLYFGYSPDYKPFFLLISFWIAVFAMRAAGNQYHSNSGQPVFIRKSNMFISSGNLKNNVIEKIGIITLISSFLILLASDSFLNLVSYERPDSVKIKRKEIMSAVSELTVENIIDALSKNAKKNPSSEKSALGNLDRISFDNTTDLTVMLSGEITNNLYIKGFTGGLYKDNTWWELPDNVYRPYSDMFTEMKENNCMPQNFSYKFNSAIADIYPESFRRLHAIVKTEFLSGSYMFYPYGTEIDDNISYIKDTGIKSSDNKSYDYSFITSSDLYKDLAPVYDFYEYAAYSNPSFADSETAYRKFVYDNYLDIPDSEDIRKMKEMFSYIPEYDGTNAVSISDTIREILHSSAGYTLNPGKTPAGRDMAYYMITESHKGYCSYFATAAILLARMSGIPARYSEGYVIIPDDIRYAEKVNSYYSIQIKDTRSHAWAEFYIEGYGWIPFEFTPGYDNGIISTEHPDNPELTRKVGYVTEPEPVSEITVTVTVPVQADMQPDITTTSPAEETKPSASKSSGNNNNTSDNGNNSEKAEINPVLKFILIFILLAVCIILAEFFIHEKTVSGRKESFRSKSNKQNISNIYRYVSVLLLEYGISKGNMLPLEFAEYAEENAGNIAEPGEITDLINTVLKSEYSQKGPSEEEVKKAAATADKIALNIYRSKTGFERFRFRYLRNLIK